MPATPDPHRTDDAVHHLARLRRAAGSPGEHEAARWIADRLRDLGADARVEEECVHGTYWWPLGLLNAVGVGAALLSRGRRWPGALLALAATAGLGDDLDHRSRAFRRMALPRRVTCNVVAHVGDRAAARTALVVVHHDAAHGGAVFDPRPIHLFARLAPRRHARSTRWPPLLWTVIGGPLLVALGAATGWPGVRDAGALLAAGAVGFMVDIGRRAAVPGANDNASGVAAMLRVAEALRDRPLAGLHVMLISTGAEEANAEGMQAFGRRHFGALDRATTPVLVIDTVGSGTLCVPEAEGFLVAHAYDAGLKDLAAGCAAAAGIEVTRGLSFVFATDAQIAQHAGFPAMTLGSIDAFKLPAHYHQPSDVPEHLHWPGIAEAATVIEAMLRALAARSAAPPGHR